MAYGLTKSSDLDALNDDKVLVAADSDDFDFGNTFTIELWYKPTTLPSGNSHGLVGKWTTSGNQRSYGLILENGVDTKLRMNTDSNGVAGGVDVAYSDALTLSTGTWYHIAASVSSGTCTFYLDGADIGGGSGLGTPYTSTSVLAIGAERSDGSDGSDGLFSLVRMWKGEARTSGEIGDNMCEVLGSTTNLSAEWTLDDIYTDNSGNSHTLTANNSPVFVTDVPATCAATIAADNALTMCNF